MEQREYTVKMREYDIADNGCVDGEIMDFKGRLCRVIEVDEDRLVRVEMGDGIERKVEPSQLERVIGFVSPYFQ